MPSGSTGSAASSSTVDFPISESPQRQGNTGPPVVVKVPHLPFRRISLPTVPSLLHRVSVVSVASFDPFPEVPHPHPPPHQNSRQQVHVHVKPDGTRISQSQSRPVSVIASPRRRNPRRDSSVKPIDDRLVAKCRKVVDEFYETEKAYVDGLELIYSHFLTPIITSLDTPEPLLNRSALTSIFSNFIDIWNLHRSFLSALTALLEPVQNNSSSANANVNAPLPKLSPLLLAHFPYLSLYTPFITAFPSTISALNELITPPSTTRPNPQYNPRFAAFLATQENDARCNKLKMRDWLLTIVQRCPRYLLLLKDLINSTNHEDSEHAQLTAVHTLVSKITLSLNTSLQTHAQTMSLLALQKATPNLPFQLISPGRTLLRRGGLLQAERNDDPVEREFLLFSDCMVWLAPAGEGGALGGWDWSWSGSGSGSGGGSESYASTSAVGVTQSHHNTPVSKGTGNGMTRTRSKSDSEAELETMRTGSANAGATTSTSRPVTPQRDITSNNRRTAPPPPNMAKRYPSADDRWVYKGRVELVDVQIIVGSALEDERKFEVLSPEASASERDEWTTEIRGAKAQLLVSLNITNPNSTLTSSASTNHVRRALQALPYHPSDDRLATLRGSSSMDAVSASHHTSASHGKNRSSRKDKEKEKDKEKDKDKDKEKDKEKNKTKRGLSSERRRKVEHWVPAIWIPDGKTSSCMRCGRMFGWRRRRHHCRLCGRCVCAGCSGQTFYITDANTSKPETSSKPARACDACYESVFPLIYPSENSESEEGIGLGPPLPNTLGSNQESEDVNANANHEQRRDIGADTIASLSRLPSWLSMPALPVQRQPQALMDIDINSSRDLSLDVEMSGNGNEMLSSGGDDRVQDRERRARLRVKSHQKLRSYHEILGDFQEQARERAQAQAQAQQAQALEAEEDDKFDGDEYNDSSNYNYNDDDDDDDDERLNEEEELEEEEDQDQIDVWFTPTHSLASSPVSSPRKPQRREDTARRSKRFSLPAIALHTTSVTARTADVGADAGSSGSGSGSGGAAPLSRESSSGVGHGHGSGNGVGNGGEPVARSRRFSLVSGGRNSYYHNYHPDTGSPTRKSGIDDSSTGDLARGLAAARLSELLGRKTSIK